MAQFYDALQALVKTGRVATAASTLGETEQKVSSAVDIILPSLLGKLLKKGNAPEVRGIVEEAGKMKLHNDYNQIWEGSGVIDGKNMGERMENQLLGVENPKFYSAVAAKTGMKAENADRLTNWVAGTIAAFMGEKTASGKSYESVLGELSKEKNELQKDIPSNIISELGLASVLGAAVAAKKPAGGQKPVVQPKKKTNWNWLMWLALILLILLLFFWWRSCDRKKKAENAVPATEQVSQIVTVVDNNAAWETRGAQGVAMILPDGQRVNVYQNSCEDCLEAFLKSDKFKNATEAELKTVWFQMSEIKFEHNSAIEMMADGETQVQKVADMLKKYPNVKVRVGAFADKTGTTATNYRITEKRADNIGKALVKAGVTESSISTEGFGEGYADVPVDANDAARAIDRDIALRFTK